MHIARQAHLNLCENRATTMTKYVKHDNEGKKTIAECLYRSRNVRTSEEY